MQVRDGNLLTDKGTRLRGVTFGLDGNYAGVRFDRSLVSALSEQTGLNALHIYVENASETAGKHADEADSLVELTSAAGMYLIVGIGGGTDSGKFDLDKIRATWSFYAPRYAARTHVLYEIRNAPDNGCNVAFKPDTIAMEKEVYGLIRSYAPSTHIALFSFNAQPTGPALEANLDALGTDIDWSKASVAFHTQPCAGHDDLAELLAVTRPRGIATFGSEMPSPTSYASTAALESERVGWFNFEWLVFNRDPAAFRSAHDRGSISWCPDFGTWPEDSETCSTP